jgi:hypothetical protein
MDSNIKLEITGQVANLLDALDAKQRNFLLSHYLNKRANDLKKFIKTEHGIEISIEKNQTEK